MPISWACCDRGQPGASRPAAKGAERPEELDRFRRTSFMAMAAITHTPIRTLLIAPAVFCGHGDRSGTRCAASQFILHHADFLLAPPVAGRQGLYCRPRRPVGRRAWLDPAIGESVGPFGPLMIADYLRDGFAQWLGQFLLQTQGFSPRWDSPRWLDLIFHDDNLTPEPPRSARIPAGAIYAARRHGRHAFGLEHRG